MKKAANTLKSFDIEFQPFVEEINAKESVIRKCADAATMERIRCMFLHMVLEYRAESNASIQSLKVFFKILRQN